MKISMREALAFALVFAAGCVQPQQRGPIDYGIVMQLYDLTTNYPAMPREGDEAPLMFTFQGNYPNVELAEFERTQLAAWQRSIRVVTWPERELVPGHWEVRSQPWRIMFVQDAPFAERWYAWQINLATLPASLGIWPYERPELGVGNHAVIDGWVTSRFHVGSLPLMRIGGLWEDGMTLGLGSSEVVISPRDIPARDLLRVTAGGRPIPCEPSVAVFAAGMPITGQWRCRGTLGEGENLTVSLLTEDLVGANGIPARFCGEGHPPTWTSQPGGPNFYQAFFSSGACADSAFLPAVAEGL